MGGARGLVPRVPPRFVVAANDAVMYALKAPSRYSLIAATAFLVVFALAVAPQAQSMLLIGGPVELIVDGSTVVAGQSVATDASTMLQWEGRRRQKKITVETSAPGQVYTLRVVVVGKTGDGTIQPEVTLLDGMFPQDLVRDIRNKKEGRGFVQYTASVAPGQEVGSDTHTVTFTLTDE